MIEKINSLYYRLLIWIPMKLLCSQIEAFAGYVLDKVSVPWLMPRLAELGGQTGPRVAIEKVQHCVYYK